jgi:1,2-phenylacetyl-CoA epoxidase catalytic subunit
MERTYEILKTTDSLSRAVENQSLNDVRELLIELRDDMREFDVDDESYSDILKELNELIEKIKISNRGSLNGVSEDLTTQIFLIINRIDGVYLRNKNKYDKNPSEKSVEEVGLERDMYQTKSIQIARVAEQYRIALLKQLENQQELYDTIGETVHKLTNESESSDILESTDIDKRLEELEQVDNELEKMRSNTADFREKHGLDE